LYILVEGPWLITMVVAAEAGESAPIPDKGKSSLLRFCI